MLRCSRAPRTAAGPHRPPPTPPHRPPPPPVLAGVCTRYLQTDSAQTVPTLQLAVVLTVVAGAGLVIFIAVPTWALALYAAARRHQQRRRQARAAQAQQAEDGSKKAEQLQQPATLDVAAVSVAVGVPSESTRSAKEDHMLAALVLRGHSSIVTSARLKLSAQPSLLTAAAAERERRAAWRRSYGTACVIGTLVALQALTLVRPQLRACRRGCMSCCRLLPPAASPHAASPAPSAAPTSTDLCLPLCGGLPRPARLHVSMMRRLLGSAVIALCCPHACMRAWGAGCTLPPAACMHCACVPGSLALLQCHAAPTLACAGSRRCSPQSRAAAC